MFWRESTASDETGVSEEMQVVWRPQIRLVAASSDRHIIWYMAMGRNSGKNRDNKENETEETTVLRNTRSSKSKKRPAAGKEKQDKQNTNKKSKADVA
jgi:hypothetical protein